jgi:signal transduction histidine kinase
LNKRPRSTATTLTDALVHDADEQRRRLARTIHDGPAQTVSAAAMNLELVERDAAQLGSTARDALSSARKQLQECAAELSHLSHQQEPPFLGEGGLLSAVLALARRTGQRLDLQIEVPSPMAALGRAVELGCYRLLELSLTGVFTEDRRVAARLTRVETQLSLTLSGTPAAGPSTATQLLAFRHRARVAGAQVVITRPTRRKGGRELRLVVRFLVARPTRKTRAAGAPTPRRPRRKKSGGP